MSHLLDTALTTPEIVSDELGIPPHQDGGEYMRISRYILVASSMFVEAIGYKVHYEEGLTTLVGQPRGRNNLIVSSHLPIKEIHEITYKDSVVDPDNYTLSSPDLGYIRRTGKRVSWPDTEIVQHGIRQYSHETEPLYQITYDAGFVTPFQAQEDESLTRDLPHDIEQAIIDFAVHLYNRAGSDSTVQSKSTGNWSVSFRTDVDLPILFEHVVNKYRRVTV